MLHEELQTKGYLGHYQRVKMAVAALRRDLLTTSHASDHAYLGKRPAGWRDTLSASPSGQTHR